MPAGQSGKTAAIGSASVPIHISSKSKHRTSRRRTSTSSRASRRAGSSCSTTQVPAIVDTTAQPTGQFGKEVAQSWQKLVDDGGLTFFHDWSSPTMLETIGQSFQELLAGKASVGDVVSRIQKDWSDYDSELKSGS